MIILDYLTEYLNTIVLPSYKYHIIVIYSTAIILYLIRLYIGRPLVLSVLSKLTRRTDYELTFVPIGRTMPMRFLQTISIILTNILPLLLPVILSIIVHLLNPRTEDHTNFMR